MSSLVPVSLYDKEDSSLFVDPSMELDLKPMVKQQLAQSHILDTPCLLASTPEIEQALLNLSAACSVGNAALAPPSHLVTTMGSVGSVANPYTPSSCSPAYSASLVQSLFRPETSESPLSTASNSASVTPSPLSGGALQSSGLRSTAFPFDRVLAGDSAASSPNPCRSPHTVKSASVHSQSVAAALAGLPLAALQPGMQDQLKKQRKKERNRVAAMKCRKRKLEREADLETRVSKLKEFNGELTAEVTRLRQQVCLLKQTVMKHVNGGCTMVTPGDLDVPSLSAN